MPDLVMCTVLTKMKEIFVTFYSYACFIKGQSGTETDHLIAAQPRLRHRSAKSARISRI